MQDFTLKKYGELIDGLRERVGPLYGVLHWHQQSPERGVLVRHDVDRKPANALAMAKLEANRGFSTTYYFRVVGSAFNREIIREVASLGHEVGYHYEDLSLAKGDMTQAHGLFHKHLGWLRELAQIDTVAMHGSPLSRHNNVDMWKQGELAVYGLQADAFLSVDYSGMPYFTDTGRSWSAGAANLRDKPASAAAPPVGVHSSTALLDFVERERPARLSLSAHPERWAVSIPDWCLQLGKDTGINAIKRILRSVR